MNQWTKAKVQVYFDSVLCLVIMNGSEGAITRWEGQVEEFKMSSSNKELLGTDGEPIEFEWKNFPGFSTLQIVQKIQDDLRERTPNGKKSQTGSCACQCSTTSIGQKKGNDGICVSNSEKVKEYAKRFSQGHWTFLGPGDEKKWYGTLPYTPEGKWDSTADQMVERFKDTGHPVFKSISALSRGILKKKNGRDTINLMRMLRTPSS